MYHRPSRQCAAPQVQPVIAELLRTCVHPPILHLQIERIIRKVVELESDSENERRPGHATKLLLTDGHLVIQALLHRKLSTLPEIADLRLGDILEIHKSVVKKAQNASGHGQVVYLGIDNCYVIKAEGTQGIDISKGVRPTKRKKSDSHIEVVDDYTDETSGGFLPEDAREVVKQKRLKGRIGCEDAIHTGLSNTRAVIDELDVAQSILARDRISPKRKIRSDTQSDDEEAFETIQVNLMTAKKRRQALHELSQNVMSSPVRPPTRGSVALTYKSHISTHNEDVTIRNDTLHSDEAQHDMIAEADGGLSEKEETKDVMIEPLQKSEAVHPAGDCAISESTVDQSIHQFATLPRTTAPASSNTFSKGPLHTLVSLYSPSLPSKSYVFSTLVIPTYVASHLISRPNSPFPPKRHIKVIDQSLATRLAISKTNVLGRGITVSVYRDAVNFKPTVGKVALMRGVVMQRLSGNVRGTNEKGQGEVILNVYPEKSRINKQSQPPFGSPRQSYSQGQGNHANQDRRGPLSGDHHNIATHDFALDANQFQKMSQSETQLRSDKYGTASVPVELPTDTSAEVRWFIDDHKILQDEGFNVDSMQAWWNQLMGLE